MHFYKSFHLKIYFFVTGCRFIISFCIHFLTHPTGLSTAICHATPRYWCFKRFTKDFPDERPFGYANKKSQKQRPWALHTTRTRFGAKINTVDPEARWAFNSCPEETLQSSHKLSYAVLGLQEKRGFFGFFLYTGPRVAALLTPYPGCRPAAHLGTWQSEMDRCPRTPGGLNSQATGHMRPAGLPKGRDPACRARPGQARRGGGGPVSAGGPGAPARPGTAHRRRRGPGRGSGAASCFTPRGTTAPGDREKRPSPGRPGPGRGAPPWPGPAAPPRPCPALSSSRRPGPRPPHASSWPPPSCLHPASSPRRKSALCAEPLPSLWLASRVVGALWRSYPHWTRRITMAIKHPYSSRRPSFTTTVKQQGIGQKAPSPRSPGVVL